MNEREQSNMPTVGVFWTGGFDSTFRIVQLSRRAVRVQPWYLSDDRASEGNELAAIEAITRELQQRADTKCEFLPLKVVRTTERVAVREVTEAFCELRKTDSFGTQYEWLACFARENPGVELSIHQDDKAIALIRKYGALKRVADEAAGEYFIVDADRTDPRVTLLFGNFHIPLAEWTKLAMKRFYLENGYEQVMNRTWFCHHPIKGKPCGFCGPCTQTIEEGLKERFSGLALVRYAAQKRGFSKVLKKLYGR